MHKKLINHYGEPQWRIHLAPLDELISTILSQNTNDINRDKAFENLTRRFSSWEKVRDADVDEIINAIRPAGLANIKGPRIKNILRSITDEVGSLSIEFLKDYSPEQANQWLQKFKGVGPKTAAIVLLFSLGLPAFPVDTHVHRISGRVGLRPEKMSADKAHIYLASKFPSESFYAIHLNLIKLGREICKARVPKCNICPINDLCLYYKNVFQQDNNA